jgi:hypothetical protein
MLARRLVYNGRREAMALGEWDTPSGGSGGMRHSRSRRPFVRARGTRYAQWTVLIVAAALLGRLAWQGYRVLYPMSRQGAGQSARVASNPMPVQVAWQRDVMESIEASILAAQRGNITSAEVAADRASSIITMARLQSQAAAPDFFVMATDGLDHVLQQHPENERLLDHVTDTRIELAQLRTWQTARSSDGGSATGSAINYGDNPVAAGGGSAVDLYQSRSAEPNVVKHISVGAPREIAAGQTLDPKSLGGNYLDATLMPDSSEILLPPSTRLVTDNVRVENLTIAGAAQTLDNVHWKNVTFIGTRLRFEDGLIDLQNVHFVRCTFGFISDVRGARLANAIALGQNSIMIQ